jgi:ectoine hydroxylase-related dioxygenase (phytanoyl-CoA dioxygenase family)
MNSKSEPVSSLHSVRPLGSAQLKQSFADDGYLVLKGIVDAQKLSALHRQLAEEFAKASRVGALFSGGGRLSGHLNCFPGAASRFVYEALEDRGVVDLVRSLSSQPFRRPNIGCNFNLPGSSAQNVHVDGYAAREFLVVNVAAVDTDLRNGAMEILARTHKKHYKLWQILVDRPESIRLCMKQGDVAIRTSTLWHRGMPNSSPNPRPMLAFTWEDGGSTLPDPYAANDGRVRFFPNRFPTHFRGRLRERLFVAAPGFSTALRAARSLLES